MELAKMLAEKKKREQKWNQYPT
jgi:hypothetical protein